MQRLVELRYLRDGPHWALDAEWRDGAQVVRRLGRQYLEQPGLGTLGEALAGFAAAYEEALVAGDQAGGDPGHAPAVTDALRQRVRPAAERLGAILLPAALQEWLALTPAPRLEIICDGDLQGVPFEAVWWQGDFLGFRFAISRRLVVRHQGHRPRLRVDTPPRCAVVADPGDLLNQGGRYRSGTVVQETLAGLRDGWQDGSRRQLQLPPASCRLGEATPPAQVQALLATHDVFVLLAHHEADQRDPGSGQVTGTGRGVQLGPDAFYSGTDLLAALPPGGRLPWLLCWPCCQSGTGDAWRGSWREPEAAAGPPGLAAAALRLGVPQFIGTTFEVHAEFVAGLVGPLLAALDDGQGSAEALRQARVRLRAGRPADPFHPGTLPGLAFLLLGDGGAALLAAGGERLDYDHPAPPAIHWCREPTGEAVCGRAIAPGEDGYGLHRCRHHSPDRAPERVCASGHPASADALRPCGQPGCDLTFCPRCRTHRHARCWRHAGDQGPLRGPDRGRPCADPHRLHPGEPRTVGFIDPGFAVTASGPLCAECLDAHRRRTRSGAGLG